MQERELAEALTKALPWLASTVSTSNLLKICRKTMAGQEVQVVPPPDKADLILVELIAIVQAVKAMLEFVKIVDGGVDSTQKLAGKVIELCQRDDNRLSKDELYSLVREAEIFSKRIP